MAAEDYVGPPYHEKRVIHQTHFKGIERKLESDSDDWVEVSPGRWRRKKELTHEKEDAKNKSN